MGLFHSKVKTLLAIKLESYFEGFSLEDYKNLTALCKVAVRKQPSGLAIIGSGESNTWRVLVIWL